MKNVLGKLIPSPLEMGREAIIVMAGVTIAALVISRVPQWKALIEGASVKVKSDSGEILWA